ncbi:IS4 family transposase [Micromonospora sp. NBC_01813]|uniref:IS4 family transposase n=1 Tax=Micromonospora sp. NBC_01813 TaxID=2975988 RepID=UPI002DDC51EA|nr:IS4 family transposase [Micromonospora sp. NBC_01813]WSA07936.1 IS4 family transposase [Micromonospora sp. NBC_01813]WSA07965.1 IS4 family transposase [Micromonospora sp. NBC_01813]
MTSSVEERPQGRLTDHIGLGVVSARFGRDLLEEILNRTGRREKRSRRLPAHVMVRYVIAMGLFFAESYDEVMRRLVGNLRKLGSWDDDWQVPTKSAITQARQRLGPEPMKALFERAAVPLAGPGTKGAFIGRRRLMAIDATSFDVADTPDNAQRFGRLGSGPKASAYPKLHVAAVAECGSHAIVGAVLGGCRTGERTLAADLTGTVGPGMLVMADAGLYSYDLFNRYAATGADLAWRIGASVSVGHLNWLADGSYHALIYAPGLSAARRARLAEQARAGHQVPAELARLVRVVEYTVPDRNPDGDLIVVITTVTDPHDIDALTLAEAYHQRWEEESALDEIKTDLRGRGEVLRSKTPDLVEQQMWGLLLAHYAIRALLLDAADPAGYDPDRMSFIKGLRVVRRQVTDQAAITP